MRKLLMIGVAMALMSTPAFAWQRPNSSFSQSSSQVGVNASNRLTNSGNSYNRNSNRLSAGSYGNQTMVGGTTFNSKAYAAPGLAGISGIPGANVCTTSAGVTGSGLFGGAGFSFPWKNHECDVRSGMMALSATRQGAAAVQMGCLDDDIAQALEATGVRCLIGPRAVRR